MIIFEYGPNREPEERSLHHPGKYLGDEACWSGRGGGGGGVECLGLSRFEGCGICRVLVSGLQGFRFMVVHIIGFPRFSGAIRSWQSFPSRAVSEFLRLSVPFVASSSALS